MPPEAAAASNNGEDVARGEPRHEAAIGQRSALPRIIMVNSKGGSIGSAFLSALTWHLPLLSNRLISVSADDVFSMPDMSESSFLLPHNLGSAIMVLLLYLVLRTRRS